MTTVLLSTLDYGLQQVVIKPIHHLSKNKIGTEQYTHRVYCSVFLYKFKLMKNGIK
ncbi:protein of unknown function [Chryseobacterium sp. JV274]|nr:protein of unknown function [Chryseobacterium sp. JV274]